MAVIDLFFLFCQSLHDGVMPLFNLRPMKILSKAHEILQAVWSQGVHGLVKFWSELCSVSTLAFCIDKHIVGGYSVLQTHFKFFIFF